MNTYDQIMNKALTWEQFSQLVRDMSKNNKSPNEINKLNKLLKKFIKKYAPPKWKQLVLYTRYNDVPIKDDKKVESMGFYVNGITMQHKNDLYVFISKTIVDNKQEINSTATFNKSYEFIKGSVNMFSHGMEDDDDGSYHVEYFDTLLKRHNKIDWDVVE